MPTLTVIVPVYKVELYIRRCIDSILKQEYVDFELILVDDGSPDKSGEICDEYAIKDCRIKVIHQKNGGLSAARNSGIDIAKGEYITFIDSDDYIHPKMFSTMIYNMEKFDAQISICSLLRTTKDSENTKISFEYKTLSNIESLKILHSQISFITAWGKIYKTDLFQGVRFPEKKYHEDEFTTYKLFYNSKKIIYTEDKLYFYYTNPESITQSSFSEKNLDALDAFAERIAFFTKLNEMELALLSQNALTARVMYSHQCINRENNIKNKKSLYKKVLSYLGKNSKKDYINNLSIKQKLWVQLFFISPCIYSKLRNILKIGL